MPVEELEPFINASYRGDMNDFRGRYQNFIKDGPQEPVYLALGQNLFLGNKNDGEAFNFGPRKDQNKTVFQLVKEMNTHWKKVKWEIKKDKTKKKESKLLKLNSLKSKKVLGWEPILNFKDSVKLTTLWYKRFYSTKINCFDLSSMQLFSYEKKLIEHFRNNKIKF